MTYTELDPQNQKQVGRPSKLTEQVEADLLTAIRGGAPLNTAAAYAGVTYETVQDWVQRGQGRHPTRKSTAEFARFARALTQAREEARLEALTLIRASARGGRTFEERSTTTRTTTTQVNEAGADAVPGVETVVTETVTSKVMLPDWRGAAWLLERSYPDEFGRAARAAAEGAGRGRGPELPEGMEFELGRRLIEAIRESADEGRELPPATGQGIRYADVIDEDGNPLADEMNADDLGDLDMSDPDPDG